MINIFSKYILFLFFSINVINIDIKKVINILLKYNPMIP